MMAGDMTRKFILTVLLLLTSSVFATLRADDSSPDVRHFSVGASSPPATLADLDWLIGAWEGPLREFTQEHIVERPRAGQLPGFVRCWTTDDTLIFYEVNAFVEMGETVEFRVKHFSGELAGWEPQDEYVRHRLIAREGDAWFFDGITFVRTGPDTHTVHVEVSGENGASEIVTVYQTRRERTAAAGAIPTGAVVPFEFESNVLADNRIGIEVARSGRVYLPPSYATSPTRRYPVVYFCHNAYWSPAQAVADGNLQTLMERGFAEGVSNEFILVIADYTGPTSGSLYENSTTSGRWLDYTVEEIVPRIDAAFRTIPQRESRALIGDFWGGRGSLALAMYYPEMFGSVYAMHPVATGSGSLPMPRLEINWPAIHAAKSWDEVGSRGRDQIFTSISQAFLPNANRPPLYCDFPMDIGADGSAVSNPAQTQLMLSRFLLDSLLDERGDALRSLRGLAIDWGRFDPTQAHVISNRRFSRMLASLGIPHEAEEHAGGIWDRNWGPEGRFISRVLPFLGKHLAASEEP